MTSQSSTSGSSYRRIYAAVRKIPRGRVATYGQIARVAGLARHARQVGYALSALGGDEVPWHRVINAKGEISPRGEPGFEERQRALLRKEGVTFTRERKVRLAKFQWKRAAESAFPELGAPPR